MMNKMKGFGAKLARSPCSLCLAILGIVFIVTGLVFYLFLMHSLIHKVIAKKIAIAEGSETYEKWSKIPMPIYYRYYFFNVSNAVEIEKSGARPVVKEFGPFTYRSSWHKTPIIFHPNGTVSFRERKVLRFVREMSVAGDDEKILTTINGPLTVTLALLQKAPLVVRNIVSLGLSSVSEGFFVKRSVRELLYDGYPEVLTSFGPLLNPSIPNTKGRFGWMYGRNNTDDGLYTVYTGVDDIRKINRIDRFNGKDELAYWKAGSECNQIRLATDGQIVATAESGDEKSFDLFHPEICRKIRFVADHKFNSSEFNFAHRHDKVDESERGKSVRKSESNRSQVPAESDSSGGGDGVSRHQIKFPFDRYIPDPDTFSSADDYPPNSCYVGKITPSRPELGDLLLTMRQSNQQSAARFPIRPFSHTRDGRLYFKSGVFDLSTCKYGAPVLLSFPHFLHAHDSYRENIHGLRPDPARHQFSMLIEPRTGTSIASYARLQINLFISKPPWVSRFRYIPEVVFPVFWQELKAEVPSDVIEHINWALTTPFTVADIFSICLIVAGLAMIAQSAFLMMRANSKQAPDIMNHKEDKNPFGTDNVDLRTLSNAKQGFVNNGLVTYDEEPLDVPPPPSMMRAPNEPMEMTKQNESGDAKSGTRF